MSTIAARKAAQVIANAQQVIAIELLCAAQALSLRLEQMPDAHPGRGSEAALKAIRALEIAPGQRLDVIRHDMPLAPHVARLADLVRSDSPISVML